MAVSIFGVRHHGPGSARALVRALDELEPDAVLIEGPPDADAIVPLALREDMRPPVAILVYSPAEPRRAVVYPFASFSPEWLAMRHALARDVPVRFVDLPAANALAVRRAREGPSEDPLAQLAALAGYDDPERWWEDAVEHRTHGGPFEAIAEAMAAVRADAVEAAGRDAGHEARREAHMRRCIRAAVRQGFTRIAVVCGAWHVPALRELPPARHDDALLRGLPKLKVAATWIPWTHGRLALESGYGAGVTSPGWYHHLFTAPGDVVSRWMARVARVLREHDVQASSASAIEAVRLAEALAALRGRPFAGLTECMDASLAVMAAGSETVLTLVRERLVVGEELGSVPEDAPSIPLHADLAREQRRLRLKAEASERSLVLDLRREIDRDRSHLLHRLDLLGVTWGVVRSDGGSTGTFRETWSLRWEPELAVALVEASMWGTTVAAAASAKALDARTSAPDLASLTRLAETCLVAGLEDAVVDVMAAVADRAALEGDVSMLMDALPPIARAARYGTIRRTDAVVLEDVARGIAVRVAVGLPPACASLDDDAAGEMVARIDAVQHAVGLVREREQWDQSLARVSELPGVHGSVAGRTTRILLDSCVIDSTEAGRRLGLALSAAADLGRASRWAAGFLAGSALVLLHDDALLGVLDGWIASLHDEQFESVVPLLRRTFSEYPPPERRRIGERVKRARSSTGEAGEDVDHVRGTRALALVTRILEGL